MNKRATERIFGLCFALVLAAVFLFNLFMPDKEFSDQENRVLQKLPEFSVSSYAEGRYESKLENYANDQFLFRNFFIKIKAAADITFGKLEANGVYRGRGQYLMEDITSPAEGFDQTVDALSKFKKSHKGMQMHFLLAPNAANILEKKLPTSVKPADQDKYMDEFFASMKDCGIKPIDVRKTFDKAAEDGDIQLYYRTDHHWTTDGAFLAYKQAAKKMHLKDKVSYERYVVKNDFRGTLASKSGFVNGKDDSIVLYMPSEKEKDYHNSVIYYSDTKKKTTEFYQLNNLDKKDAYTVFGGSNHPLYTIKTPMKSKETLLLVKDSYANSFIPFLAQNFREIVVVDPRYYFGDIDDIIKKEGVTQVMFLYNANTFFADNSLKMMLGE